MPRFSGPLLALLIATTAAATARADEWKLETSGAAEADALLYRDPLGEPTRQTFGQLRLEGTAQLKYGRALKFRLAPKLALDPLNPSLSERYWIDLPEGFVQDQVKSLTLQTGFNTFSWGVTDGYNPLDVVNARRYFDPLRSEKLGAWSVTAKVGLGPVNFEALYIPWQRKSLLPGNNSRWLPREVLLSRSVSEGGTPAQLLLPGNLAYSYSDDQVRDAALDNNYGGRIQASGILSGLDLSVAYFEGAAPTPAIDVAAGGRAVSVDPVYIIQVYPDVGLTPVYYRQRVWGGSVVYANFGMIFRAETAITRTISKGVDLPDNAEEYVGGVERSFALGHDALTVLAQVTYAHHSEQSENGVASLTRIFDRALIIGLRYPFSEALTVTASGVLDTVYHGQLAHFEGSYGLNDTWKLTLAADGLWGDPNTPTGTYRRNDRLIAGLRASF